MRARHFGVEGDRLLGQVRERPLLWLEIAIGIDAADERGAVVGADDLADMGRQIADGEADAAMIPTWLKDQYPNLTPVKTSRDFPGQCITASPDVPADLREKVKDALLKLDTDTDAAKLLFELGVTKFVPASAKEYAGDEQSLKSFIGYQ